MEGPRSEEEEATPEHVDHLLQEVNDDAASQQFIAGNMDVFPDLEDAEEWEAFQEEEYDNEGFLVIKPVWKEIWVRMLVLMKEVGLIGEKLALQKEEVPRLLTQLLDELEVGVERPARDYLTARIYEEIERATEDESRRKRFKGHLSVPMQRITDAAAQAGKLDVAMEASAAMFFFPPKGIKARRSKKAPSTGQVFTREQLEMEEKKRWEGQLIRILMEGQTPAYELALKTQDPQQAISRLIGKTRASTLKGYLKKWMKMVCWLQRAIGQCWPRDLELVLDYIEVIAEDLHPTVPQSTLQALQWVEKAGGYRGEDAIFYHPSIVRAFDNLTVEAGTLAKAKKQAPRYPFVFLAAAELFATNISTPIMKRIHAGSLLFRSYGTLRFDDLQNMDRLKIRKVGSIYVTELLKSKTSGPGKRNPELPVAISANTTLLETDWLLRFLEDLEESNPGKSDFLLFSSTYDGSSARPKMKTFEESSADTRQIASFLKIPTLRNGKWVMSEEPVIPQCCIGAIKEHGGRAVLPSMAIFTEPEKSKRDMLGKWLVTGGSADYTRSFRANVSKMQTDIIKAVRSGRMVTDLREDDIGDQFVRYLTESRSWDQKAAEEVVSRMFLRWESFYKELADWDKERNAGVTVVSDPGASQVPTEPDPIPVLPAVICKKPASEYRFMIVYTKNRRVACLHKVSDGCAWTRVELNDYTVHDIVVPEQYNKRCRMCWGKNSVEEDSSDTSSPSE